jgi:hypothetical protein
LCPAVSLAEGVYVGAPRGEGDLGGH